MSLLEPGLKYPKPKILMVDMPSICSNTLRDAGYNVSDGSFGFPYRVEASDEWCPIALDTCSLPNRDEQEIVFANLACPDAIGNRPGQPGKGVMGLWQQAVDGKIDPRPFFMNYTSRAFERILSHGGIFVVFLAQRYQINYARGANDYFGRPEVKSPKPYGSWSLLQELDSFASRDCRGSEIQFDANYKLSSLLKRAAESASYTCTLAPDYIQERRLKVLAKNKFGSPIAGILEPEQSSGRILVLPQMPNVHTILLPLIEDYFTDWSPGLFPDHEGARWLHRAEYEIPAVKEVAHQIGRLKSDADAKTSELRAKIEQIRSENQDWYALLNGTGDGLVAAVIHSLETIGFQKVIDVDKELREQGNDRNLREDIQIQDRSPFLIVDVKGITGCPEDAEATQSEKHALIRAREMNGDVQPLTIINHQRNMPPHDRQREPYRTEIVDNAKQTGLGLMTTWDIFRVLRNKELLKWPNEVVTPIFYRTGRIRPIPEHYIEVGSIVHVWQGAFGVVPDRNISVGSRLAIETGNIYEEIVANSLQVNGNQVNETPAKSDCGIAVADASKRFKEGMKVFVVRPMEAK